MKRLLLAVPVILLGLTATGCAERYGHGYARAPRYEMRHERQNARWHDGHWEYTRHGRVWRDGYWR